MSKKESELPSAPGEVWYAWQPFFTHDKAIVHEKGAHDNRGIDIPRDVDGVAVVPVNRHPALILARGDERELGWLVCYFSTKPDSSKKHIPKTAVPWDAFNRDKSNYFCVSAPQYCPNLFFKKQNRLVDRDYRFVKADQQLRKFVNDAMTFAMNVCPRTDKGLMLADILNDWFNSLSQEPKPSDCSHKELPPEYHLDNLSNEEEN